MVELTFELASKLYEENHTDIKIAFRNYYKYYFDFDGENSLMHIEVGFGGHAEDIYRHGINRDTLQLPETLTALQNEYNSVIIKDKKNHRYYNWSKPYPY